MRILLMMVCLLFGSGMASARVQVGVGISLPGISIGINLPQYPQLVLVPGYPVYYAPALSLNYFHYDGMYWVFADDNWYVAYWYNGPWYMVYPDYVPLFLLRVPVYYYRRPPAYFHGWWLGAPPRWHERWGRDWEQRHSGWRQWDMSASPAPAPLPDYQRDYPRERYPDATRQGDLHRQYYRYQPRDGVVREHQQSLEDSIRRPARQWSVPAPKGGEPPGWSSGRVLVSPPQQEHPEWRDTPSWQRDRDDRYAVPPVLQRQRVIQFDDGPRGRESAEPGVRRFRGGPGPWAGDEGRPSSQGEVRRQERPGKDQRTRGSAEKRQER